jgi:hypothetical protein
VDIVVIIFAYLSAYSMRAFITPLDLVSDFAFILAALVCRLYFSLGVYNRIWSHTSGHGFDYLWGSRRSGGVLGGRYDRQPRPLPISVVGMGTC